MVLFHHEVKVLRPSWQLGLTVSVTFSPYTHFVYKSLFPLNSLQHRSSSPDVIMISLQRSVFPLIKPSFEPCSNSFLCVVFTVYDVRILPDKNRTQEISRTLPTLHIVILNILLISYTLLSFLWIYYRYKYIILISTFHSWHLTFIHEIIVISLAMSIFYQFQCHVFNFYLMVFTNLLENLLTYFFFVSLFFWCLSYFLLNLQSEFI